MTDLALELAVHGASNSYQTSSQQAQRSRFGNTGYDVGIAARNTGRPVEEASTGVNGQLRCGAVYDKSVVPGAAHGTTQSVIVRSIGERHQRPRDLSGEGAIEKCATRKVRGAGAVDNKAASAVECAAHLQAAAR